MIIIIFPVYGIIFTDNSFLHKNIKIDVVGTYLISNMCREKASDLAVDYRS